jgi:hypothetical protein
MREFSVDLYKELTLSISSIMKGLEDIAQGWIRDLARNGDLAGQGQRAGARLLWLKVRD